jgi:hypothetical protein
LTTWTLTVAESIVLPRSYSLELVKNLHHRMGLEIGGEEISSTTYLGILGYCSSSKDFLTFNPEELYTLSLRGLQESTAKAIALNRHRLQTAPFRVHTGQVTGFKGEITLRVLNHIDPLLANVANLLIRYSDFAGTGIKTRLGMGQTVLMP